MSVLARTVLLSEMMFVKRIKRFSVRAVLRCTTWTQLQTLVLRTLVTVNLELQSLIKTVPRTALRFVTLAILSTTLVKTVFASSIAANATTE